MGDELRQARVAARDARLRTAAEADVATRNGEHEQASRQHALAASYQAMHDVYRRHETALATAMTDRADWELTTRQQRQLAVAADTELRRRHPGQSWLPLRSAEPDRRAAKAILASRLNKAARRPDNSSRTSLPVTVSSPRNWPIGRR